MKKRISSLFLLFFTLCSVVSAQHRVRIACIGNSITYGAGTVDPAKQSYPSVLNALLVEHGYPHYEVNNYGIGSATILHFGTPNVWPVLDSLQNHMPDIVIIKAGTNETVGKPRYNWEHIAEFEKDYSEFLTAVKKINPNCKIIICSPLDIALKTKGLTPERLADLRVWRPRIWQLRKRVKQIAKSNHTFFLDLTKAFEDKADLIAEGDGVHPNVNGYHYLANVVFNFLEANKLVKK